MGCGCSGNRNRAKAAGGGAVTYTYAVTLPGETEPREYLTPLEAKRVIRRNGGGTIKRVAQPNPPA